MYLISFPLNDGIPWHGACVSHDNAWLMDARRRRAVAASQHGADKCVFWHFARKKELTGRAQGLFWKLHFCFGANVLRSLLPSFLIQRWARRATTGLFLPSSVTYFTGFTYLLFQQTIYTFYFLVFPQKANGYFSANEFSLLYWPMCFPWVEEKKTCLICKQKEKWKIFLGNVRILRTKRNELTVIKTIAGISKHAMPSLSSPLSITPAKWRKNKKKQQHR